MELLFSGAGECRGFPWPLLFEGPVHAQGGLRLILPVNACTGRAPMATALEFRCMHVNRGIAPTIRTMALLTHAPAALLLYLQGPTPLYYIIQDSIRHMPQPL